MPYKSIFAALVLALFLGPVGTLYASWKASIIMLMITVISIFMTVKVANSWDVLLAMWVISIYLSVFLTERYNKRLLVKEKTA